jgi:hypothetical protein
LLTLMFLPNELSLSFFAISKDTFFVFIYGLKR